LFFVVMNMKGYQTIIFHYKLIEETLKQLHLAPLG
jgi:hypothetical protein